MTVSHYGGSLDSQLTAEAGVLAARSGVPYQRVLDCSYEMFTFHCATGGDLDCACGAHRDDPMQRGHSE
jgi:hypothetical protein